MAYKIAGGTKWWQVRAGSGVEAEWIVMKKDWKEYKAQAYTEEREGSGEGGSGSASGSGTPRRGAEEADADEYEESNGHCESAWQVHIS